MHKMDVPLPKARVSEVLDSWRSWMMKAAMWTCTSWEGHWDMILTSLYPPLRLPNCSIICTPKRQ